MLGPCHLTQEQELCIKFGGEVLDNRFLSNHTRTTDEKKERGPHNLQLIREQKIGQSFLFYILKDNQ